MRRWILLALTAAALPGMANAQTSVDIRTGPGGQLSGSASAGGAATSVDTGRPDGNGAAYAPGARSDARCTGNGRTMTVTSPDGSSSSSVSTSSSDGIVSVGGGGSRGARITEGGCGGARTVPYPPVRLDGASTSAVSASASASAGGPRHRTIHHRKRRIRRR